MNFIKAIFAALLFAGLVFVGYYAGSQHISDTFSGSYQVSETDGNAKESAGGTENQSADGAGNANGTGNSGEAESSAPVVHTYSFDPASIPAYSGEPYTIINDNIPAFSEEDKKRTDAFESYSSLDTLGRCGTAYANVCAELMPTEERTEIGDIKPSGWKQAKYEDLIESNPPYLFNRCHLIGYQLSGENANAKNLITGTHYLNISGMLPFENKVYAYAKNENHHVLYRVTPVFLDDNLVASGVELEAWSVEDNGIGVCFHVYCYNVQPGIGIDYATGKSWESGDQTGLVIKTGTEEETSGAETSENISGNDTAEKTTVSAEELQAEAPDTENDTAVFILNISSMKIHLPDCECVSDISDHNKNEHTGTIAELKAAGYVPCGKCLYKFKN